ncbi:MAG: hypothetical protein RLZZ157_196 [Pseudomonadota bacterium]
MYLRLASIVAVATIILATSPAIADRAHGRGGVAVESGTARVDGHHARGGGIYVGEGGIPRGEHRLRDARDDRGDRGDRGGGIYIGDGGIPRGEHRLRDARDDRHDRDSYRTPVPNTRHRLNDRGRGADYWGPSARPWTHWDNSWGDPNRYARQWGFANYDPRRGWQRDNVWYATPSAWSQWGGWAWSFSVSGGDRYDDYDDRYDDYDDRYARNCATYRSRDWVKGQRATISYYGCVDAYGRVYEQPGTRRIERWGW